MPNLTGVCIRCNFHNMVCSPGKEIKVRPHDNLYFNGHAVCSAHFEMLTLERDGDQEGAYEIHIREFGDG